MAHKKAKARLAIYIFLSMGCYSCHNNESSSIEQSKFQRGIPKEHEYAIFSDIDHSFSEMKFSLVQKRNSPLEKFYFSGGDSILFSKLYANYFEKEKKLDVSIIIYEFTSVESMGKYYEEVFLSEENMFKSPHFTFSAGEALVVFATQAEKDRPILERYVETYQSKLSVLIRL